MTITNSMLNQKQMYGAVFFDNELDNEHGWACVAGKSAFRIAGAHELPCDVYWWSNASKGTLKGFQPRLKTQEYLRPCMRLFHAELGLNAHDPAVAVAVTSEVFSRVMIMARDYYGIMSPQQATLAEDLSRAILGKPELTNFNVNESLKLAYQTWVACDANHAHEHSTVYTLNLPRVYHAINVLSAPVPDDNWNESVVNERLLPPENIRMDWVLKQERPVLAKVVVLGVDSIVSPLIACHNVAAHQSGWMTHPELIAMQSFAKVKVEAVFLGGGYTDAKALHAFFPGGDYASMSISAGIMAANYCAALTGAQVVNKHIPEKKSEIFTPQATWLATVDRMLTLTSALALRASGFDIEGYGTGMMTVNCPAGALPELRDAALKLGLDVPLAMAVLSVGSEGVCT